MTHFEQRWNDARRLDQQKPRSSARSSYATYQPSIMPRYVDEPHISDVDTNAETIPDVRIFLSAWTKLIHTQSTSGKYELEVRKHTGKSDGSHERNGGRWATYNGHS